MNNKCNYPPFRCNLTTIGELPTNYKETLSYYETLVWLIEYLKNEIIPKVNNCILEVKELEEFVKKLEEYINNYFDNLDIQEEVNKALNKMAENGTLAKIINDELFNLINNDISTIKADLELIKNSFNDFNAFKDAQNTKNSEYDTFISSQNTKNSEYDTFISSQNTKNSTYDTFINNQNTKNEVYDNFITSQNSKNSKYDTNFTNINEHLQNRIISRITGTATLSEPNHETLIDIPYSEIQQKYKDIVPSYEIVSNDAFYHNILYSKPFIFDIQILYNDEKMIVPASMLDRVKSDLFTSVGVVFLSDKVRCILKTKTDANLSASTTASITFIIKSFVEDKISIVI